MTSVPEPGTAAFDLLAEGLQRHLRSLGWPSLRDIQSKAIKAYLQSDHDLLIMAETAGGKTEAAFLPILSAISREPEGSVRALYVGPLKALINDQFGRLEDLCTHLDVAVHRWHGDVSGSHKDALVKRPGGVLLITPESIESLLINRTSQLPSIFGGLRAIVIDEVHAFLDGERGLHLASLLSRVRRYVNPRETPPRVIGLSATVGDPQMAQSYLCPAAPDHVQIITDAGGTSEIQFRIHGYSAAPASKVESDVDVDDENEAELVVMRQVATDLVEHCRTHSNLVFANAKGDIEIYADLANELCRSEGLPEQFLVHHGSLAKDVREDSEATMKSGRPMTTICSSTLEMGIDIGSVRLVGQIGPPWSVASFKQRLGRSARKGDQPRRLRGYIISKQTLDNGDPLAGIPVGLLQTIAVCELLLKNWVEPPSPATLDLSTLTHQIISTIAETGAIEPAVLHARLCDSGPFRSFRAELFARVLRELGKADVIEQGSDSKLILGLEGERLRSRKDFYAAFAAPVEYAIVAPDRQLGTLPILTLPKPGEHIVFAARRWQVAEVDPARMVVRVIPAKRRRRPKFMGGIGEVHPRVREEMLAVLASDTKPAYLDPPALASLEQARAVAASHDLARRRIAQLSDNRTLWMTWTGTKRQRTLLALLEGLGIQAKDQDVAIECRSSVAELADRLRLCANAPPSLLELAHFVQPKWIRKYDYLFSDELLDEGIARDRLDEVGDVLP